VEALEQLCGRLTAPEFKNISSPALLHKLSVAFAIDARARAEDMALFRAAAHDFYHVRSDP
jgi:hypothetical protein